MICAWRKMVVGEQRQIVFGRSISGKVIDPAGFGVLSMKNPVVPAPFAFVLSNRWKRKGQTRLVSSGLRKLVDIS